MQHVIAKDPDEVQDYTIDWSEDLAAGESISTSTWTLDTGLTEDSETNTSTTATVWVSGGTAGEKYKATNRITTDVTPARTYEKTIIIPVATG